MTGEDEVAAFFEGLLKGPSNRPQHPDFMKLSEVVLAHDSPANDPNTDFTFLEYVDQYIDIESLSYMATQRAGMLLTQTGIPDPTFMVLAAVSSAWVDAFLCGCDWQKKRS